MNRRVCVYDVHSFIACNRARRLSKKTKAPSVPWIPSTGAPVPQGMDLGLTPVFLLSGRNLCTYHDFTVVVNKHHSERPNV